MNDFGAERLRDELLLVGRLLLLLLFFVSGWQKLANFAGAVDYMSQVGAPLPQLSAAVAVFVELVLALACAVGFLTRPLALLFAASTLATAVVGHHFWTMTGPVAADNMEHFFKNISICGGFLLLYVVGSGRYAADSRIGVARGEAH